MERTINCLECGKEAIDRSFLQNKRFCSASCQKKNQYRNTKVYKTPGVEMICIYNEGVDCQEHKCGNCGWNPKVAKAREEKIYG